MDTFEGLPTEVAEELKRFIEASKTAFETNLRSIILYGSAAEGRLRPTSDVNIMLVLRAFDRAQADRIREPLRFARTAIHLAAMFLLEHELDEAAAAFSVKFDDIRARHRIMDGDDPFTNMEVSRAAALARLRQVLLNLRLRFRERYASVGLREEELARTIAQMAGPLRACAATLCRLQGRTVDSPKAALELVVAELGNPKFQAILPSITEARSQGLLEPGVAGEVVFALIDLVAAMQSAANRLA
ncbi:MAG: nucleotidyltransferase domain-containing protein [Candidatus Hydrogenedentales bacterium]|jgi:predicted nucleotidyltransferase